MPDKKNGIEELLSNESFLAWYFRTDPSEIRRWEEWMGAHPANQKQAENAVECLLTLRLQEAPLEKEQLTLAINRLLAQLRPSGKRNFYSRIPARGWWMAAASVLVLAAGIYGLVLVPAHKNSWSTTFGEVRKNQLPDGTEILANADTRITYAKDWKEGKDREVWLTGEAFFHVSKTPQRSRFVVHLEHFDIIVTGTRFNAVNRPEKTSILLEEGSVTLQGRDRKELKMQPGDFVEFADGRLSKRPVKPDSCLAWKDRRLFLDNTPLSQLVKIIHEQYGIIVQPADEQTANRTVSGILANDNLEVLLRALEFTGDFKFTREKDKLIIKDH